MKEYILLTIKGFFIGLANIIPGVSGGTMAITLGIYEKLIGCISHLLKNLKENINYVLPTVLFFIGAILGGIPMLFKKIKGKKVTISNIITFLISFSLIIFLMICNGEKEISFENMNIFNYIMLFIVGIVASATMVIPGVSGSAVMMTRLL